MEGRIDMANHYGVVRRIRRLKRFAGSMNREVGVAPWVHGRALGNFESMQTEFDVLECSLRFPRLICQAALSQSRKRQLFSGAGLGS